MGHGGPGTIGPIVERATRTAMARVVRREQAVRELAAANAGTPTAGSERAVHRLRTAVRRLRVVLAGFEPHLERDFARGLRRPLAELSEVLAAVRDLDVVLARLERPPTAEGAVGVDVTPFVAALSARRSQAFEQLGERLAAEEHVALMGELRARAVPIRHGDVPARRALRRRLRATWRRTRERQRDEDGPGSLHELRKSAKRLRHLAEVAEGPLGRPARRLAGQARRTQDLLGGYQDAVVLERLVRGYLTAAGPVADDEAFALGALVGRAHAERDRIGQAWPHRWHRLSRRAHQLLD